MVPFTTETAVDAALAVVVLVIAVSSIALHVRRRRYAERICRRWSLDPARVRVIASDLGRHRATWSMRADGLIGNPDVIFRDRNSRRLIVGEAKSRHFKGDVTPYERYQVTLYLGMAKRLYRMPATAIILFGNGRRVPVEFDPALYERLLTLLPDCRKDVR